MSKPVCVVIGIGPKNGAAFCRVFAEAGYQVAMLSRSTELSEKLAAELGDARGFVCDASDPSSVARAISEVTEAMGRIETVVYNAGSGFWGNIEEITAAQFEASWRVNALGLFAVAKAITPEMIEAGSGSLIVVGATASLRGKPFTTAFAPAKAAQRSLAQALARHLGPKGIHVALLIIDGQIGDAGSEDAEAPNKLDPLDIARAARDVARQRPSAWTFELDLRPRMESW